MLLDAQKLPSTQLAGHYRSIISDANSLKFKVKTFFNRKVSISLLF
jgi:hypothetical protein